MCIRDRENTGFETAVCEIPAGEASKCVEQLSRLWECMMDFGLTRTDAVVAPVSLYTSRCV